MWADGTDHTGARGRHKSSAGAEDTSSGTCEPRAARHAGHNDAARQSAAECSRTVSPHPTPEAGRAGGGGGAHCRFGRRQESPPQTQDVPSSAPQAVTTARPHGSQLDESGLAPGGPGHRSSLQRAARSFSEGARDHLPWSWDSGALQGARRQNRGPRHPATFRTFVAKPGSQQGPRLPLWGWGSTQLWDPSHRARAPGHHVPSPVTSSASAPGWGPARGGGWPEAGG